MIDIFSYDGKGVLPVYLPGVPGYGQKGAPGNTGESGSSIYFSSYNLGEQSNRDDAVEKIKNGLPLSNNQLYTGNTKSINYIDGDIFIDTAGNFYILKKENGEFKIEQIYSGIYSQSPIVFNRFDVEFKTSFVNDENIQTDDDKKYLWRQENPLFISADTNDRTGNKIHDDYYSQYIYGNFIRFNLNIVSENPCDYRFYLEFPSGETLDIVSESSDAVFFIDNKYCYSCNDFYEYTAKIPQNSTSIFKNIADNNGTEEYTKSVAAVYDDSKFGPASAEFTALTEHYIAYRCKIYADVTDRQLGNIYRFDFGEAYLSSDHSEQTIIDAPEVLAAKQRTPMTHKIDNAAVYLKNVPKIVIPKIGLSKEIKGEEILENGNNKTRRVSRGNSTGAKRKTRK